MTETETTRTDGLVRRAEEMDAETVEAADGLEKTVLLDESHGAPNVAIRRFTLEPGGDVPKHTNEIEHEQYVLAGEYTVGIGETEYTVGPGDAVHVPAGTVHWYRNDSEAEAAFVCAIPTGDDSIELV